MNYEEEFNKMMGNPLETINKLSAQLKDIKDNIHELQEWQEQILEQEGFNKPKL
jgi:hypothetical protein